MPRIQTKRGYTGHEQVDELGFIHMNGRIYDLEIGRFLSADPTMQFPEATQGFNRYAYAGNNPLTNVDPSGFSFFKSLLKIVGFVLNFVPGFQGWANAFVRALVQGFLMSRGDLRSGLLGIVTSGLGSYITSGLAKAFAVASKIGAIASSIAGSLVAGVAVGVAMGQKVGAALRSTIQSLARSFAVEFAIDGIAQTIKAASSAGTDETSAGTTTSAADKHENAASSGAADSTRPRKGSHLSPEEQLALQQKIREKSRGVTGKKYNSEREAAQQFQRAFHDLSMEYDVEIGAQFFRDPADPLSDGVYMGTAVTQYLRDSVVAISGSNPPEGWEASGFIHTHGRYGGNGFSGLDKGGHGHISWAIRIQLGGNAWLAAPDGHLYKWDYFAWKNAGEGRNFSDYVSRQDYPRRRGR